jgi:hypothetical protein
MVHAHCLQPFLFIVWIGGWGFALVRYPRALVGLFTSDVTLTSLRLIRVIGIAGLTLALIAFPVELARFALNCLR